MRKEYNGPNTEMGALPRALRFLLRCAGTAVLTRQQQCPYTAR